MKTHQAISCPELVQPEAKTRVISTDASLCICNTITSHEQSLVRPFFALFRHCVFSLWDFFGNSPKVRQDKPCFKVETENKTGFVKSSKISHSLTFSGQNNETQSLSLLKSLRVTYKRYVKHTITKLKRLHFQILTIWSLVGSRRHFDLPISC